MSNLHKDTAVAAALDERADASVDESEGNDHDDSNNDQRSELKEKLEAFRVPDALIKNANEKQLKRMLEVREDRMSLKTLGDFGDRWIEWKNFDINFPEGTKQKLNEYAKDVYDHVSRSMRTTTSEYTKKIPVCQWFLDILNEALFRYNFQLLRFQFHKSAFLDLPKSEKMQWAALGSTLVDLKDAKIIDDVSVKNLNSKFEVAVGRIGSSVLPSFVHRVSRLQGVLAGLADRASQFENKLIALGVTTAFAVIQYSMKFVELYVEERV